MLKSLIYSVSATNFHQASRLHLFIDTTLVKYCYIQNSNESSIQDKTCQDKEFFFLFALAIFSFKVKVADSKRRRQRLAEEWVKGKNFIFWFVSFTDGQIYRQILLDFSWISLGQIFLDFSWI